MFKNALLAILSVCLFLEVSRFNADTTGADCNRSEGKASVSWHSHQKNIGRTPCLPMVFDETTVFQIIIGMM